jgi:hypothetical protein
VPGSGRPRSVHSVLYKRLILRSPSGLVAVAHTAHGEEVAGRAGLSSSFGRSWTIWNRRQFVGCWKPRPHTIVSSCAMHTSWPGAVRQQLKVRPWTAAGRP